MNENIQIQKEKKRATFFHHDVDGLTSASLVLRALKDSEIYFFPQDPNEKFPEVYADEVFVVDVALTEKTWNSLQNLHVSKLVWIDHHKPFADPSSLTLPANVQLILDPSAPSAVKVVRQFFGLNDAISEKIEQLGTKADQWKLEPEVQDWMDLDMAYSYFKKDKAPLIKLLAQGKLEITGELKDVLERYRAEKEEAKKELLQNTVIKNVHGHTVAIGLAPEILSGSESADILLKETQTEIQIIVKPQGWMSFRRAKSSTVNLLNLAKIFGGGGHEYASGAELGRTVSLEDFPKIAQEILEKISSVL